MSKVLVLKPDEMMQYASMVAEAARVNSPERAARDGTVYSTHETQSITLTLHLDPSQYGVHC